MTIVVPYSGKVWWGFWFGNLVVKRNNTKLNSADLKPCNHGYPSTIYYYALYQYFKKGTCILPRGCGFPFYLSGKEIHVTNTRCTLWEADHGPTCPNMVWPWSQAKYNEYTQEERVKMRRYATEKRPSQGCQTLLSAFRSQDAMHKAYLTVAVIFGWGTESSNVNLKIWHFGQNYKF